MDKESYKSTEEEPPGSRSWESQLQNRIKKIEGMPDLSDLRVPFAITSYYFDVISKSPQLKKTMIPSHEESVTTAEESADSLGEEHDSPVKCIVHRYPDRVLFLATDNCASYCRYCTRSRVIECEKFGLNDWVDGLEYIKHHTEIRDVIISGGDPLTLSDNKLMFLLCNLREMQHIEIIRLGTKVPVVMPQRITQDLVDMIKRYHPVFMSIHFTHPDELTEECKAACNRLADAGIPLGSQTVLLKDVNDNVETMKKLMQGLLKIRVKPYYIYMCDLVKGTSHFRTSVKTGLDIIQGLRGWTSGYAIPQLVIDLPGGGGKVPILPEYLVGHENGQLIFKNYEGKTYSYPEA
jgi:lysine 2,3-aminomutase